MADGTVRIRRGLASDADALSALAVRAKAHWGYPDAWLEAWRTELTFTPATFDELRVWVAVAEDGDELLGVVAVAFDVPAVQVEIEHLWVDPFVHGRGVGRHLMAVAQAAARTEGVDSIRVVSDPNAVGFYRALGAVHVGSVEAPVCGTARSLPILRLPLRSP